MVLRRSQSPTLGVLITLRLPLISVCLILANQSSWFTPSWLFQHSISSWISPLEEQMDGSLIILETSPGLISLKVCSLLFSGMARTKAENTLAAMYDFARAQDTWYGTWPQDVHERALAVYVYFSWRVRSLSLIRWFSDYVKMWQLCWPGVAFPFHSSPKCILSLLA